MSTYCENHAVVISNPTIGCILCNGEKPLPLPEPKQLAADTDAVMLKFGIKVVPYYVSSDGVPHKTLEAAVTRSERTEFENYCRDTFGDEIQEHQMSYVTQMLLSQFKVTRK